MKKPILIPQDRSLTRMSFSHAKSIGIFYEIA